MLSNSCKYGIRAVIYLATRYPDKNNIGIKEISHDLNLPAPFLAKILQQLAKNKLLNSSKGPRGGFYLLKNPGSISLLDIIKIIDGDGLFKNCIIHDGTCAEVKRSKKTCPVHDDYSGIRSEMIRLFRTRSIADLVKAAKDTDKILI